MALPTAHPQPPPSGGAHVWRRALAAVEAYPLERIGFAALAAGIVLRILAPFMMDLRSDGDTYAAMGHAWAMHGQFLMPYGDVTTWGPAPPGHSNHYPPAYPFFLGVVFKAFGFGLWQAKWAAVFVSLAALAVVYYTTRDLYGNVAAALATGLMAVEPHLLWVTGAGFSENMVLLFFALTMWAIVKSLNDDRYIVLAGLFAGLTYLSRASVGYFFVVAGMGGLLWRLLHRGWSVLLNPWYLTAIALFLGIAGGWAVRNVLLFGTKELRFEGGELVLLATLALAAGGLALLAPFVVRRHTRTWLNLAPGLALVGAAAALAFWRFALAPVVGLGADVLAQGYVAQWPLWETSSYTRYIQELAWQKRGDWGHALGAKVPLFLGFALWYAVPLAPESWRALRKFREEQASALWLSVFLVFVIAWAIAGMFWVFERSSLYWMDNRRYVVIGLLPLVWLALREMKPQRASFRARYALLALGLFAACAATIMSPVKFADLRAAEAMDPYLEPGDEVVVDGNTIKYAFYAYLTNPEEITITGFVGGDARPHFIVTLKTEGEYGDEYTRVGEFRQRYWNAGVMTAYLYAREDVIAARDVPTFS